MKIIFWKLKYALYMWLKSNMSINWCYNCAESSIENNPDDIWEYGPIEYAKEDMSCWSE